MNLTGQIFPLRSQQITKYSPHAVDLYLNHTSLNPKSLSKQQKIIISKIFRNLNILCKLTRKQLKQLFKQSKQFTAYQQAMSELYFNQQINNYILINKQEANVRIESQVLRKTVQREGQYYRPLECVGVDYKLEFTISNINKKKVMRPIILLVYRLSNGSQLKLYYSIQEFNQLRYQVAENVKKVYGIELKTMF